MPKESQGMGGIDVSHVVLPSMTENCTLGKQINAFLATYHEVIKLENLVEVAVKDILLGLETGEESLESLVDDALCYQLDKNPVLYLSDIKVSSLRIEVENALLPVKQYFLPYLHEFIDPANLAVEGFTTMSEDYRFNLVKMEDTSWVKSSLSYPV